MNYVTDTHSLVWYFTDDTHLSKNALEAFEETINEGIIIVPSIVLAEIMFIANKGKISLTFEETLKRIEEYENFDIAPLNAEILKVADKIETDLEIHDKLIIATALYFKSALITRDDRLRNVGICSIIW
jgi:PIN domain nuclease of toxin-antitoxin system